MGAMLMPWKVLEATGRGVLGALSFLVPLGALAGARPLFAQGCAMCYTSAAAAGPHAAEALDHAILALLVPALVLFASIFVLLIRRAAAASH